MYFIINLQVTLREFTFTCNYARIQAFRKHHSLTFNISFRVKFREIDAILTWNQTDGAVSEPEALLPSDTLKPCQNNILRQDKSEPTCIN